MSSTTQPVTQTDAGLICEYLDRLEFRYVVDDEDENLIRLYFGETDVLPPSEISIQLHDENRTVMISWDDVVQAEPDNNELLRYMLTSNREYVFGKFGYEETEKRVSWIVSVRCSEEAPLPFDVFEFSLSIVVSWIETIFPKLEELGGTRFSDVTDD